MKSFPFCIHYRQTAIVFGASWLLVGPALLWGVATFFLPLLAPSLRLVEQVVVTGMIAVLTWMTLLSHALAHLFAARHLRTPLPARLPLYLFGDAAQVWPMAVTSWREILVSVAGPVMNLILAGIAYLIWDLQLHTYINASALFLIFANAGMAILNFAPGFPLDGGRLMRVFVTGLVRRATWGTYASVGAGWFNIGALVVWGIALINLKVHFGFETGLGTILAAGLLLLPLWQNPANRDNVHILPSLSPIRLIVQGVVTGLLLLFLFIGVASLTPMVHGLYAPGSAVAVKPMIIVAPEHRHQSAGTFFLTTVIAQTPITAGQWVQGQFDPAITIVPPEQVVPPDITPQELVERNFALLEESELVATVVALQQAGYSATLTQEVVVSMVVPDSPADGVLQPGDRIVQANGISITDTPQLIEQISAQPDTVPLTLQIARDSQVLSQNIALRPASKSADQPRLGVRLQTIVIDTNLPFPVRIVPQKIVGGPSAGLMFALTIYDMVTPNDLTGGRLIAGTGTIDRDSRVGPIGGVEQKVAAAERAKAAYFLVPPENAEAALRVAKQIEVIPVATFHEALAFLQSLPPEE
ncbi:MAG: PDZ domain-containing protein [Chloroflexales bacterium]|nr:PDZ domain-containing protein [Chloroflexales bacterium]